MSLARRPRARLAVAVLTVGMGVAAACGRAPAPGSFAAQLQGDKRARISGTAGYCDRDFGGSVTLLTENTPTGYAFVFGFFTMGPPPGRYELLEDLQYRSPQEVATAAFFLPPGTLADDQVASNGGAQVTGGWLELSEVEAPRLRGRFQVTIAADSVAGLPRREVRVHGTFATVADTAAGCQEGP